MTDATKLFHFTSKIFITDILTQGLCRGLTPIKICGQLGFLSCHQWLTTSRNFTQSWEKNSNLPYRRNQVRLEIKIPKNYEHRISCMNDMEDRFGNYLIEDFFTGADRDNWRVYYGHIPALWIKNIKYNGEQSHD